MPIGHDSAVVRQLRTLFELGSSAELSDGQLLERFATERGETAELALACWWSGMDPWFCASAGACSATCTTPRMHSRRRF